MLTVAPFAGAWIEILKLADDKIYVVVAPFAGAWIEISCVCASADVLSSRSLRGSVD